jgi:hypothetical protein
LHLMTAIPIGPFSPLWTPRQAVRRGLSRLWTGVREAFSYAPQFGPDGKIRFKDGKVLFAQPGDPCCCALNEGCCGTICTIGSPCTVKLAVSGVTRCGVGACYPGGVHQPGFIWNSGDPNRTICLPLTASGTGQCQYSATVPADIDFWCGTASQGFLGCGEKAADFHAAGILYQVFLDSSGWNVFITVDNVTGFGCAFTASVLDVVSGDIAGNCRTVYTLNNLGVCSVANVGGTLDYQIASGGTIVLTPGGC